MEFQKYMALLSQLISSAAVLGVSWNLFDHVFTLTQVEKCKVESRKTECPGAGMLMGSCFWPAAGPARPSSFLQTQVLELSLLVSTDRGPTGRRQAQYFPL